MSVRGELVEGDKEAIKTASPFMLSTPRRVEGRTEAQKPNRQPVRPEVLEG